jgi:predicted neutral ceramidase superfamily lipid hydrolase
MTTQETLQVYVTLAVWGLMLLGLIKIFGIRRVVWGILLIVFFAVVVAFKGLGVITSSTRRY